MKKWIALVGLVAAAAACADSAQPVALDGAEPSLALTGVNADGDAIDDGLEADLAARFAPVLYMPNLITQADANNGVGGDWTWPASVQWYLANTQMRFHHASCPDHQIMDVGTITTSNVTTKSHQRSSGWLCSHSGTIYTSAGGGGWSEDAHFFLQAVNDGLVHPGVRDASQWPAYVRVYSNAAGGYSIQYWFFYAYNDFIGSINHEGDWEHVTVSLNPDQTVRGVYFAQHNGEQFLAPSQVSWYGGTHPQVWVADGSHASFASEAACDGSLLEGTSQNCWTNVNQRWFTWAGGKGTAAGLQGAGLVNVGEAGTQMPGQGWMKYSGRWGELGEMSATSGPRSPMYQGFWTTDQ
jgi:hypothetical protein